MNIYEYIMNTHGHALGHNHVLSPYIENTRARIKENCPHISSPKLRKAVQYNSIERCKASTLEVYAFKFSSYQQHTKFILHIRYSSKRFLTRHIINKFSYPCNRPWRPWGLWDVEDPTLTRQSAHRWWYGCEPYARAVLYSPETLLF
jgi:hypothetical protein